MTIDAPFAADISAVEPLLGVAEHLLDKTVASVKRITEDGKLIDDHQVLTRRVASMAAFRWAERLGPTTNLSSAPSVKR